MVLKILVLTYFIGIVDIKYYFFEDYIVKEYHYKEGIDFPDSLKEATLLYDLKTNKIYTIPFSMDQRNLVTEKLLKGTWTVGQTTILKTETEKTPYLGIECLKVTKVIGRNGPFGYMQSKESTYYAKIKNIIPDFKKKNILLFLGIKEFKYKPFIVKMKTETEYDETEKPFTIFQAEINLEEVDPATLENILKLPVLKKPEK